MDSVLLPTQSGRSHLKSGARAISGGNILDSVYDGPGDEVQVFFACGCWPLFRQDACFASDILFSASRQHAQTKNSLALADTHECLIFDLGKTKSAILEGQLAIDSPQNSGYWRKLIIVASFVTKLNYTPPQNLVKSSQMKQYPDEDRVSR
jgi:hypothetical protein